MAILRILSFSFSYEERTFEPRVALPGLIYTAIIMRKAGFVMAILGIIPLVLVILSLIEEAGYGRNLPFVGNSWIIIIGLFFFLSGVSLIVSFGKAD
jgi:hypothetical protein